MYRHHEWCAHRATFHLLFIKTFAELYLRKLRWAIEIIIMSAAAFTHLIRVDNFIRFDRHSKYNYGLVSGQIRLNVRIELCDFPFENFVGVRFIFSFFISVVFVYFFASPKQTVNGVRTRALEFRVEKHCVDGYARATRPRHILFIGRWAREGKETSG